MNNFCEHQMRTKDNPNRFDCLVHLAYGIVYACSYDSFEEAKRFDYIDLPNGKIEVTKYECVNAREIRQ